MQDWMDYLLAWVLCLILSGFWNFRSFREKYIKDQSMYVYFVLEGWLLTRVRMIT